jgi:hypothetical protein
VKIWQSVAPKQPDELVIGVPFLDLFDRIDAEPSALLPLEVARANSSPPSLRSRRSKTRIERGHVFGAFLQGIPRRDQPPHFVESQSAHRGKTDVAMSPVRGVEGSAKETDAGHERQLAWARMRA